VLPVPTGHEFTPSVTFAKTLMIGPIFEEFMKMGAYGDGGGHAFGFASCHWIRPCNTNELVGTKCSDTQSGVTYTGYCFKSDTGSVECGRLSADTDEYSNVRSRFDRTPATGGVDYGNDDPHPIMQVQTMTTPALVRSSPGVAYAGDSFGPTGMPGQSAPPAYRCPTGSPAKTLGVFVSKRPLMAGCMLTGDAMYDPMAEVHVLDYCQNKQALPIALQGCMLPAAVNFNPMAKQSINCHFATLGCTDSNALKYNPEATIDDGSCLAKVRGCTVHDEPYEGVEAATPAYRSGFYGSKYRSVASQGAFSINPTGRQDEGPFLPDPDDFIGKAVKSFLPSANVLHDPNGHSMCVVAVEGCMDSNSKNYDPLATVNSNTWCVPIVPGCMMPSLQLSTYSPELETLVNGPGPFAYDGLAKNFDYYATENKGCEVYRLGCMDSGAYNYDPLATVPGTEKGTACFFLIDGCLNPLAVNYGCAQRQDTPCPDTGATHHVYQYCKYPGEPPMNTPDPPSPPPPVAPSGGGQVAVVTHQVLYSFTSAGSIDDNKPHAQDIAHNYAQSLGIVDASGNSLLGPGIVIHVYIIQGAVTEGPIVYDPTSFGRRLQNTPRRQLQTNGVTWNLQTTYPNKDHADAAVSTLNAAATTNAGAQTFLGVANIPGMPAIVGDPAPVAPPTQIVTYKKSGLTDAEKAGAIAGGVIGGVLIIVVILVWLRMRQKKAYAKTVVPA